MGVSQISVFVESKPGHLKRILDAFENTGVSVRGYSASDTGDYGIVRFILDDPKKGLDILTKMGSAATMTDIVCLKLNDKPGELARIVGIIAEAGINVVYSYSLISTYIALKVDDVVAAEKLLETQPVELASQKDLANDILGNC